MKTKSQSGIWDKVSLGLGWPSAAWVTEQPRAGEEAEGKGNVKDGCCHLSKSGIGERGRTGQGEQGLASVRPRSQVGPGRRDPRKRCEQKVAGRSGVAGAVRRRGPDTMAAARRRWDADGARPPSLPKPLRCVEPARAHLLGVLSYCPILRPPNPGAGRTGRRRLRARTAATPPLGSRRRGGAWRAALWERRGGGRGTGSR